MTTAVVTLPTWLGVAKLLVHTQSNIGTLTRRLNALELPEKHSAGSTPPMSLISYSTRDDEIKAKSAGTATIIVHSIQLWLSHLLPCRATISRSQHQLALLKTGLEAFSSRQNAL